MMKTSIKTNPQGRQAIFFEALEQPDPDARSEYLDLACAGDRQLRVEVEHLLAAHFEQDSFLQSAAVESAPTITGENPLEAPGAQIDRYKLLQLIGEGGFGTVYMAEQEEPVRRRVALKIIKAGMDTRQVIARFEAERQALAMMDHPNIAKVLDAGSTASGRPYFVMEVVRGLPITKFCDENRLTTAERLALVIEVCSAVQHAHQKGVIHRDLKPSNVLVTMHDDRPVPKVIDFGIAKATDQRLTDKTLFTRFEQFVGTPAYISPEQAQMSGLDVDTRSDIYSLGVLLYELLTGTTPFDAAALLRSGYDEIRRKIREEEPPKPSSRLETLVGETRTLTAERRRSNPNRLFHQLRGELDWIVMKAIEKDRTRRYETANGFAADLNRYLHGDPVTAAKPSALYALKKFARRHRPALMVVTGFMVVMLVATILSASLAVSESRAKEAYRERLYASKLTEANFLIGHGAYSSAATVLDDWPAELENWAWEYLSNEAALKSSVLLARHGAPIHDVCLAKDGTAIFTAGEDGKIKLWRVADGQLLATLGESESPVRIALARDERHLASVDDNGNLVLWDLDQSSAVATWFYPGASALDLAPDGSWVVAGTGAGSIALFAPERRDGPRFEALGAHPNIVTDLAVSPGGDAIVSAAWAAPIKAWNPATLEEIEHLAMPRKDVRCLAFTSDGSELFAAGTQNHEVLNLAAWQRPGDGHGALDEGEAKEPDRWTSYQGHPYAMAICRDQPLVVIESGLHLDIRHRESLERVARYYDPGHHPRAVAITADGHRFFTGGTDGTLRVWNTHAAASWQIKVSDHPLRSVGFSPDGSRLAVVGKENRGWFYDTETFELVTRSTESAHRWITDLDYSPDGRSVAIIDDGDIVFWDAHDGSERSRSRSGAEGNGYWLDLSPDGRWVARMAGKGLAIANLETGENLLVENAHNSWIEGVCFSPDSRIVATSAPWDGLRCWRPHDGTLVWERPGETSRGVTWSPDGSMVACGNRNGSVSFHRATDGEVLGEVSGHAARVTALAFSPDGAVLFTGSSDGTVKVWDVPARRHLVTFWVTTGEVWHVAVSPDGSTVAASDAEGYVTVWESQRRHLQTYSRRWEQSQELPAK